MSDQPNVAAEQHADKPIPISSATWLILIVAGLTSFAYHYNYGGVNHAHLLPLVNHYQDPTTYQHDYIIRSYQHFLSYFWYAVAFLAQFVRLKALLLTLDAVWCVLTAWAVYCLSWRLFGSVLAGRIAVLMLVLTKASPAGIYISLHGSIDPYSHTNFVLPFLLIAWRWALEGKWLRAFGAVGLLANIHVVSAAFFTCMLGIMILVNRPERRWLIVVAPLVLVALAGPVIYRVLSAVGPDQITTSEQIDRLRFIYHFRMPYHRFPSTWGAEDWVPAFAWWTLGAIGFFKLRAGPRHRMMLAAFVVLLAILAFLYFAVEVWPFSVATMAFPFGRAGRFAVFIAVLYVAAWAAKLLESSDVADRVAGLCLAAWGVGTNQELAAAAFLPLIGLVPDAGRSPAARKAFAIILLVAGLILAWAGWTDFQYDVTGGALFVGLQSLDYNIVVTVLVTAVLLLIGQVRRWPASSNWVTAGLVVLAVMSFVGMRGQRLAFLLSKHVPFDEAVALTYSLPNPHWIEMQEWVDRNLPRDAVLLTPPHAQGFRIHSKRAIVVEWKDPGIITCSYLPDLFEWERRVRAYTGVSGRSDKDAIEIIRRQGLYSYLSEDGLIQLARTFNAGYIVTETSAEPLSLPLLHENKRGRLYQVDKGTRPRVAPDSRR